MLHTKHQVVTPQKNQYTRANASSNKTVAACMKLQKPDMPKELF